MNDPPVRRTRIVATLGPASSGPAMIRRLLRAGVNVVRMNFSHGSRESHGRLVADLRGVAASLGLPVAVLADLRGPKMRVGRIAGESVVLRSGRPIELVEGHGVGSEETLHVEAGGALARLGAGAVVRLADGLIELAVERRAGATLHCSVVHGGTLRSRQGVNIPGLDLGVSAITRKDRDDLAFAMQLGVDAVALSFVADAGDVLALRRLAERLGGPAPFVVAKIERAAAMEHLDGILEVASGVMVARGDLGVELGFEKVPAAQRRIVAAALRHHKPVITATQMLESMIERPTPTRAEVSDIATAVMEGTDALMLSGETAVGRYPVEAVSMLATVAAEAEVTMLQSRTWERVEAGTDDVAQAVSRAARVVARAISARAVLVFTETGRTARLVSSQRVARRCYGFTPREATWRRMQLFWGIEPMLISHQTSVPAMIAEAEALLRRRRLVQRGDRLVIVCGQLMLQGSTNSILVHEVGGGPQSRRKNRANARP